MGWREVVNRPEVPSNGRDERGPQKQPRRNDTQIDAKASTATNAIALPMHHVIRCPCDFFFLLLAIVKTTQYLKVVAFIDLFTVSGPKKDLFFQKFSLIYATPTERDWTAALLSRTAV